MNAARDVKRNTLKGVLIANKLNRRKNRMTDEELKKNPWKALRSFADKLTPEQLDYCVHKYPLTALKYCADKLTEEQKKYCKEKTK